VAGAAISSPARALAEPHGAPLSGAVARRLPAGYFYVLAGSYSNSGSGNVWEVTRSGRETELTHNSAGYGISSFDASPAGIVMADAASSIDVLARLTSKGVQFLRGVHGGDPHIDNAGRIVYDLSPADTSQPDEIITRKAFTAAPHVLYRQVASLIVAGWGPDGQIAVLSGTHPPHTAGGTPKLLIIGPGGKATSMPDGFGSRLSNATWGPGARDIATSTWTGQGMVLEGRHQVRLPSGWFPAAWNAAGTELLVWSTGTPGSIGLWSTAHPRTVVRIGALPGGGVSDNEIVWLAKPARL
jgi:hypothetical protein